jgi:hypothetical protein
MSPLTSEQVKAIAPDSASLKAGQGLADARKWQSLGANEAALWGECKGSAAEPYKVRVDLVNPGYACTCPSRKFPCKHAIGLMLLSAASPGKLTQAAVPQWVADWLEKRASRTVQETKKKEPVADEASRQKEAARRAARREKLAESGLDSLDRWLRDLVRNGLASVPSFPESFWGEQSARLVDAQLPGAARLVRELAALPMSGEEWAERFLLALVRLHLLTQAYRRMDALPPGTQADVRALLGWTVHQEELVASSEGIVDDWLVVSQLVEEDQSSGMRTQTNWLWGAETRRAALVLNFAHRTQPLDMSLAPGSSLHGELVYYPGAYPLRAVFKRCELLERLFAPAGYPCLRDFFAAYSNALAKNPWLDAFPAVLQRVVPRVVNGTLIFQDTGSLALPAPRRFPRQWELLAWEMLALSGGVPVDLFGTWNGFFFLPLAVWAEGRYIQIRLG